MSLSLALSTAASVRDLMEETTARFPRPTFKAKRTTDAAPPALLIVEPDDFEATRLGRIADKAGMRERVYAGNLSAAIRDATRCQVAAVVVGPGFTDPGRALLLSFLRARGIRAAVVTSERVEPDDLHGYRGISHETMREWLERGSE